MINSRSTSELLPHVKAKAENLLDLCKKEGIDLIITSTYRDTESQDALYAQGRTASGQVVTNARGGDSWHNWRVAFDVVPLRNGKPVWGTGGDDGKLWRRIGDIGEAVGLEWAGRWTGKFREMAHFQDSRGLSLADLKAGKKVVV
jgi:peptidoglycan L-alanyl-D-glutamate endopeptidase CwlK